MYEAGQHVPFLHKQAGREIPLDAEIISVKGAQVVIEYRHPAGFQQRRTLRTPQERARLLSEAEAEVRRGAPEGNQNAVKQGPKRLAVTLSLSEKDGRIEKVIAHLKKHGKEATVENARKLAYEAIDAYLC